MLGSPGSPASAQPRPGLVCTVLRPAETGDASRAGVTATAPRVVLTDQGDGPARRGAVVPATAPGDPGHLPELQLRERRGFLIACPPDAGPRGDPYAFGGNWLWSTDARFPEAAPIAVHDRNLRLEALAPGVPRHPVTNLPLEPAVR